MATLPLIEIIKRQAFTTFSKVSSGLAGNFEDNLLKLKGLMNKVTSEDVCLDPSLFNPVNQGTENTPAPVTYIEILDDPNLTMGIFVLKSGARLPLHDHPLMYGVLKVVHGTVNIQSYSILTESEQKLNGHSSSELITAVQPSEIELSEESLNRQVTLVTRKEPALNVCSTDEACVLSPVSGNLHEIHSVNGPAAFLDVLSPPYGTDIPGVGPRPCRYFRELEESSESNENRSVRLTKLLRVPPPQDYWSDTAPYLGP